MVVAGAIFAAGEKMQLIIVGLSAAIQAFALLCLLLLCAPVAQAKGETIVRFPDFPIGRCRIVRPAPDQEDDEKLGKELWAQGSIAIPAGCKLVLVLNFNGSRNTKLIAQLPHDIIRSLACKDLEIGDKAVADFCTQTDIVALNLQGVDLTDAGLQAVGRLTKLRKLSVCDTLITEKGLIVLRKLPLLEKLNLSRNKLGDGLPAHLQNLKNLRLLDLSGTQLKDKAVNNLPRFERLKAFDLRRNNVTDRCIDSILRYKNLHLLDITDTWISAKAVEKLHVLPNLTTIMIRNRLFKPEERAHLKKVFKHTKIIDGSRERAVSPELFAPLH